MRSLTSIALEQDIGRSLTCRQPRYHQLKTLFEHCHRLCEVSQIRVAKVLPSNGSLPISSAACRWRPSRRPSCRRRRAIGSSRLVLESRNFTLWESGLPGGWRPGCDLCVLERPGPQVWAMQAMGYCGQRGPASLSTSCRAVVSPLLQSAHRLAHHRRAT